MSNLLSGFPAANTIQLGPDVMPGQWLLMPTAREYAWIEQQGWGLSKATIRPGGERLVHCSFLARFWTAADWEAFQPLRAIYFKRQALQVAGNLTYAIGIVHPELNALGVTSVVLAKSPAFTNNGKGLWTGVVEFIEYGKPKPALESPPAAIPAAAAPEPSAADNVEAAQATQAAEFTGPTR